MYIVYIVHTFTFFSGKIRFFLSRSHSFSSCYLCNVCTLIKLHHFHLNGSCATYLMPHILYIFIRANIINVWLFRQHTKIQCERKKSNKKATERRTKRLAWSNGKHNLPHLCNNYTEEKFIESIMLDSVDFGRLFLSHSYACSIPLFAKTMKNDCSLPNLFVCVVNQIVTIIDALLYL